jgi:hypothetical protein
MVDTNYDELAAAVARRLLSQGGPVPRLFINDIVTETDGARDVLRDFWQHPESDRISLVQVSLSPASAAGVYRSDGPGVTNSVGQFLPAGGGVLYLQSLAEIRNFRIQATTPGGTLLLAATAFMRDR